jgi:Caspase domain/Sel1 repeat
MPGAAVGTFFDKLPVKMQVLLALLLVLIGCAGQDSLTGTGHLAGAPQVAGIDRADDLLPVDCLLPGQVRQLGQRVTYVTRPRPIKTSAQDCRIRGGEYVAYDRADYATALKVWLPQAQEGDADAQNAVGDIYQKGMGLAPDYALAAAWYRKAADQGHSPAAINLGVMYEKGLGVPRDELKALDWYRRASGLQAGQVQLASASSRAADSEQLAQALRREQQRSADLRTQVRELDRERARGQHAQRDVRQASEERARLQSAREELMRQQAALDGERRKLQAASDQVARLEAERERLAAERDRLAKAQASPASPSPAELAQVERLKQEAAAAQAEVDRARARIAEQQALLDRGEGQLEQRQAELQAKQLEIAGLDREIDALKQEGDRRSQEAQQLRDLPARVDEEQTKILDGEAARIGQSLPDIDFGSYFALVIGNNDYRHLPKLGTAVADARAVSNILSSKYGFTVTTLIDANRYQILSGLNEMRGRLTDRDNLVVYYAGHGELDEVNQRGNWLPIDAEPDSTANWIPNVLITDILNASNAKHILVISDSCYSGSLTRSALSRLQAGLSEEARLAWIRSMVRQKSRTALTSGGLKPVIDSTGGPHSVFAQALLEALSREPGIVEARRLFGIVSGKVKKAASNVGTDQAPEYAPIQYAGHAGGEFFFVPGRGRTQLGSGQVAYGIAK